MDNAYADGNTSNNNNSEMEDKFVDYTDNKVCVNGTVISGKFIKEEPCDLVTERANIHSYVNIKDENIDDSTVVTQGAELMNSCAEHKICANEAVIGSGSIKEEPCDLWNEQGSIHSYIDIKDEDIDDLTLETLDAELKNDCTDATAISSATIKEEPCDLENEQGNIHSYINIKDEDIDDLTLVTQDAELKNDCTDDTLVSSAFIKEEPCDLENGQGNIHSYIDIKDESIDDLGVVTQGTECMNDYTYNKACVNETIFSDGPVKEPCGLRSEQGSVYSYVNANDKDIDDLMVVTTQDSACMNDSTEHTVCANKTANSTEAIKEKPCDLGNEQESIDSYINIKDKNIDDLTVVRQETEIMTVCIDDNGSTNQTAISREYIKQKPSVMEYDRGNIHSYVSIKDENIDELIFIIVQETEAVANLKVNYLLCCEECGGEYDLYCLKCPMLLRIFDSNNPAGKVNPVKRTLPKNFIDICETSSGVGVVALRTIPKGVVFGPFKGLDVTKDGTVSKWKLRNRELACIKDLKWYNWMHYVKRVDRRSDPNLTPFQYKGELYYRNDCRIGVGHELLVCWNSDWDMEDGYWEPPVSESLDISYACTLCCVGYKSIRHLNAHNSICPEKRNQDDFCKEIVQCFICKIYLDMKEYIDYHMDRCYSSNEKCVFKMCYRRNRQRPFNYQADTKSIKCESCDIEFLTRRSFVRHQKETHSTVDKSYSCCRCEYRTRFEYALNKHLARVHDDPKIFACVLCRYQTTKHSNLKQHVAIHCDDRPFACNLCPYKTKKNSNLKRHMIVHSRPPCLRRNDRQKVI